VVEIAVEGWYRAHERELVSRERWSVQWPESTAGFREIPIADAVRSNLRFDSGREASWPMVIPRERESAGGGASTSSPNATCYLYYFRWEPGSSSVLRARAHRPDICLPSAGWRSTLDGGTRLYPISSNLALPFRHFAFARETGVAGREVFAHAFFCLREDWTRSNESDPGAGELSDWSIADRVRAVRTGLRNLGQQVVEFIIVTPREMDAAEVQAKFAALAPELVKGQRSQVGGQKAD
jgi:hypothetical protein